MIRFLVFIAGIYVIILGQNIFVHAANIEDKSKTVDKRTLKETQTPKQCVHNKSNHKIIINLNGGRHVDLLPGATVQISETDTSSHLESLMQKGDIILVQCPSGSNTKPKKIKKP